MQTTSNDPEVFMVMKNAFLETGQRATSGDLFLTSDGLYYIPYSEYQSRHREGLLGDFAEGFTRGLGTNQVWMQCKSAAASNNTVNRASWFGVSLRERASTIESSVVVAVDSIKSLTLQDAPVALLCRTRFKESITFSISAIRSRDRRTVKIYKKDMSRLTPMEPAMLGFTTPYTRPADVLKDLEQECVTKISGICGVEGDTVWFENFHILLAHHPEQQIIQICKRIQKTGLPWCEALLAAAETAIRQSRSLKNNPFEYGLIAVFIVAAIAFSVIGITTGEDLGSALGLSAGILGVAVFLLVSLLRGTLKPTDRARTVVRGLTSPDQG